MFTVKTKLGNSEIHGIGVFADEFISKGTILWKYQKNFDITITDEEYLKLPKLAQDFFIYYGYYSKAEGGYVLCGDNARFTNHSKAPMMQMLNVTDSIAMRDINIGDEITEDYEYFDEKHDLKNIGNRGFVCEHIKIADRKSGIYVCKNCGIGMEGEEFDNT